MNGLGGASGPNAAAALAVAGTTAGTSDTAQAVINASTAAGNRTLVPSRQ